MLLMSIHRCAMFFYGFEQVRRIWRRDPLGREMPANIEIRRVFSLLDDLVVLLGLADGVLLRMNVVRETFVACFVFATHFSNVPVHRGQFLLSRGEFFFCNTGRVSCPESRPDKLCAFVR